MNEQTKIAEAVDPQTGEIMDASGTGLPANFLAGNQALAVSLAMAEIDHQITTARAYPRSISKAVNNIIELATLTPDTAKECIYGLPRDGKVITGPSIRFAEIVFSMWGNCRSGTRVTHVDRMEKYVEAEGVFHDLETNAATTARIKRRLSGKTGKLYNDDMIIMTGNAASSIAKRNAVLAGVPKGVWMQAYEAARKVVAGDARTFATRRKAALDAFGEFGVKPDQVFAVLGIGGLDDMGVDQLLQMVGMHNALKSGESSVEDMFPTKVAENGERKPTDLKSRLDTAMEGAANGGDGGSKKSPEQGEKKSDTASQSGSGQGTGAQARTAEATGPDAKSSDAASQRPAASEGAAEAKEPTEAEIAEARQRGAQWRAGAGHSRKAMPKEFRQVPALAAGWLAGFDTGSAEREPGEEG